MKPFFFDNGTGLLYGVYHSPRTSIWRNEGVVVCYPFAHEYIRAHRACQQLAVHFSGAGFPVLRFDYTGTGDSDGDPAELSVDRWMDDIRCAILELKQLASVQRVSLIGLRLGATLAASLADQRRNIANLVLWDPVVAGAAYADWLELADTASFPSERHPGRGPTELMGYVYNSQLREQIRQLDLYGLKVLPSRNLVLATTGEGDYAELITCLKGKRCHVKLIQAPYEWNWDHEIVGRLYLPGVLLRKMVADLAGESQ